MLKFLSICAVLVALGVVSVVSIPMDMEAVAATTTRPEATTEDTTGRLLSLPVPEKCANSKYLNLKLKHAIVKQMRKFGVLEICNSKYLSINNIIHTMKHLLFLWFLTKQMTTL